MKQTVRPEKMTRIERQAVLSLSSIMGLRMIGLFMVLPLFSLYAQQLQGATPALVGLAMSIYGLFVALFQIPFGMLSDRLGRKPIILTGLIIFVIGSALCGMAHSITLMLLGRALQGIGAVGSTIIAFIADLTREEQRTKSMAIMGISIGFSFTLAMLLGPLLAKWIPVNYLFYFATLFGLIGMVILYSATPTAVNSSWHRDAEPEISAFIKILLSPELARLNIGIFILHAIFTASFIVIPISLLKITGFAPYEQWKLYLPALLIALLISFPMISIAERKQKLKPIFLSAVIILFMSELLLWIYPQQLWLTLIGLSLFFAGFTTLEGFLPSMVSRAAPAARKGSALGLFSSAQYSGIFAGGVLGGWLYGQSSYSGVYLFCVSATLFWFVLASFMKPPRYLVTQLLRVPAAKWQEFAAKLQTLPGMVEVTFIAEEAIAYLKMERATVSHPDFIHLKEQLQSE